MTLTWSAPSDWRTLTPSGYQIDVAGGSFYGSASPPATSDHADWEKLADVAATATSYTFSGTIFEGGSHEHTVTNGTKYHLRIRAVGTPTNDPSDTHPSYWVVVSGTPQVSVGTPSMIVEPSSLTVPVGSRACYVIYPQTKPTAALRIGAISSDISTATVAGETTSDWNIPNSDVNWKTGIAVCVTGVAVGSTSILNSVASDDTNYDGVTVPSVSVTVTAADTKSTVRFLHAYIQAVEGSTAVLNIGRGQAGPGSVHAYDVRTVTVKLDIAPAPTSNGQITWDLPHGKRVCSAIAGCDQSHSDSARFNIDYQTVGLIGRQVRYTSGSNDMEFEFHIRMDNDVEEDETVRIYLLNRQFELGSFITTNHAVCVGECDSDASDVDWTYMTFRIIDDDTTVQERGVQERSSSPPPGQSPQVTYAALITKIKEWRDDPCCASNPDHTKRWDRTLLAFGETVADATLTNPMTATEAQRYADRGWSRWVEVAAALGELENRL